MVHAFSIILSQYAWIYSICLCFCYIINTRINIQYLFVFLLHYQMNIRIHLQYKIMLVFPLHYQNTNESVQTMPGLIIKSMSVIMQIIQNIPLFDMSLLYKAFASFRYRSNQGLSLLLIPSFVTCNRPIRKQTTNHLITYCLLLLKSACNPYTSLDIFSEPFIFLYDHV